MDDDQGPTPSDGQTSNSDTPTHEVGPEATQAAGTDQTVESDSKPRHHSKNPRVLSRKVDAGQDPAHPTEYVRHTIVTAAGDTLDSLAEDLNIAADKLYGLNSKTLEQNAAARGFEGSDNGRHLFPDTTLVLPES